MASLLVSVPVSGPAGRRVRVLFYDDGSIRFRVPDAAPMKLSEAFLSGAKEPVIIKLDPAEALHLELEAPILPEQTSAGGEPRRVTAAGLSLDDAVAVVTRAFTEVVGTAMKTTGSVPLGYLGVYEDAQGVHRTAWVNVRDLTAWLGVTLVGKEYDGWPIARYLLREAGEQQLLDVVRTLDDPSVVTLHFWRDAWQAGGGRVPRFMEQNITPADGIQLDELSASEYARVIDEALASLDARKQHRGRLRRDITLTTGRVVTLYVSPELQFRTQFALSGNPADVTAELRRAEELLRPVYEFVLERSRAGARGRVLETNLRTELVARWQEVGHPQWTAAETLSAAEEIDDAYSERGLNPAPKFREARAAGDRSYLQTWIAGCHFDWLNPRRI